MGNAQTIWWEGVRPPLSDCVASVVFVVFGALWWRSTREMRAMRKQFSNDNVAQECAAAIACFDLESVVWLEKVANPAGPGLCGSQTPPQ